MISNEHWKPRSNVIQYTSFANAQWQCDNFKWIGFLFFSKQVFSIFNIHYIFMRRGELYIHTGNGLKDHSHSTQKLYITQSNRYDHDINYSR